MIVFQNPKFLFFLLIIPFIVLLHFMAVFYFKRKSFRFANFETIERISEDRHIFSKKISHLLLRMAFVATLVFAMAGTGIEISRPGIQNQVIFAVDASGSMLATDLLPDRLEATKTVLSNFVGNLSFSTEIGLISFTYLGYIEQDLTDDKLLMEKRIKDLKIRRGSGTSLGSAIAISYAMFDTDKDKAIVILTDGQENFLSLDELMDIVDYVTQKGVKLYIIGVGSLEGAPMGNATIGSTVLNEELIKSITERNGGSYHIVDSKDKMLSSMEKFFDIIDLKSVYDLSLWLFFAAFMLLILEWFFANYIGRSFP